MNKREVGKTGEQIADFLAQNGYTILERISGPEDTARSILSLKRAPAYAS